MSLNDKSWETGFHHLGDVRVHVKKFEWLRTKHFYPKKKELKCGEHFRKEKSCASSEKWKCAYEWM